MPKQQNRLRIHLVGASLEAKQSLADDIPGAMVKRKKRKDFLVVPSLIAQVHDRFPKDDVGFFFALESDYMKFESDIKTKKRHLIFADSLVDRYLRASETNLPLEPYFSSRLKDAATKPGHLFLYGPTVDAKRSEVIVRYNLPVQLWSNADICINEIVNALVLRLSKVDGHI